jgi:hypothetical protein
MAEPGHDELKLASDYAWNWFSLHAGQRMQVVSFFILASSFITTAYVTAMQKDLFLIAGFIGVGGAVMALSVFAFERRTHDLLDVGRKALAQLEVAISSRCQTELAKLIANTPGPRLTAPKYRQVVGFLTLTATTLFAAGAAYSFTRCLT